MVISLRCSIHVRVPFGGNIVALSSHGVPVLDNDDLANVEGLGELSIRLESYTPYVVSTGCIYCRWYIA